MVINLKGFQATFWQTNNITSGALPIAFLIWHTQCKVMNPTRVRLSSWKMGILGPIKHYGDFRFSFDVCKDIVCR